MKSLWWDKIKSQSAILLFIMIKLQGKTLGLLLNLN